MPTLRRVLRISYDFLQYDELIKVDTPFSTSDKESAIRRPHANRFFETMRSEWPLLPGQETTNVLAGDQSVTHAASLSRLIAARAECEEY
jgi:hypothetical protein